MDELVRKGSVKLLQVGEALGIRNLDPEAGKIFITDGTGVVGHRVSLKLLRAGYADLRIGNGGNTDKLAAFNKMGAEIADFVWDREDTYAAALQGVKSVLCTVPHAKNWNHHFHSFLEACRKAGVRHFVKISFYHARIKGDAFTTVPLVQAHGECDDLLVQTLVPLTQPHDLQLSGVVDIVGGLDYAVRPHMSYTIVYASHFMSNPFTFQGPELHQTHKPCAYYGASRNHGVNYVSPNDVAEAVVRVLLEPRAHYDQEYTLTGPAQSITEQQVADLLSKHFDKPIMYVDQPLDSFKTEIKMGGAPQWMVQDLVAMEQIKATGNEENADFYSADFDKICGHGPQTFEEYLQEQDMMTEMELGAPPALQPLKEYD